MGIGRTYKGALSAAGVSKASNAIRSAECLSRFCTIPAGTSRRSGYEVAMSKSSHISSSSRRPPSHSFPAHCYTHHHSIHAPPVFPSNSSFIAFLLLILLINRLIQNCRITDSTRRRPRYSSLHKRSSMSTPDLVLG